MKLAVIAGDGIGPEVIGEALGVLDTVLPGVEKTHYDLGARRYHATGEVLPEACSTNCAPTTRSCSVRSGIRRCPAVCWNVAYC
jgi:isocitrate/isopropylmalate dehydrogenase